MIKINVSQEINHHDSRGIQNFFFKFLAIFLARRYFPKSPDIFPIYRDILNISRYIQNIENIAIFQWRYIAKGNDLRYIAISLIYRDIANICNYALSYASQKSMQVLGNPKIQGMKLFGFDVPSLGQVWVQVLY